MSRENQGSFDDDVREFVLGGLVQLGPDGVCAGLEVPLLEASGDLTGSGITAEMVDGTAAGVVANADIVAIALGHPRDGEASDILETIAPFADDLRELEGLADLAERALTEVVGAERYSEAKGICADRTAFETLAASVGVRVARAKKDYPGTWPLVTGLGSISTTMYPTEGDAHD